MNQENVLNGNLVAEKGKVYEYEKVTGSIYASGADTKTAFPKLTSVGGSIDARGADTKTAFPKLTSVGGSIYASGADTKTAFPKLTSVGGYIDASGADTKTAFPKLTSVCGSIYARGADTKTAFPKLTSVGGSIDASGADTKTAKQNDPSAYGRCKAMLLASFAAAGFSFADGVLARIVSSRGRVSRVVVCGKTDVSYVVTDGEHFSHGKTLDEARDGLLYKIGSRDTSEFKSWNLNKEVSKRDAIRAYRTITGACEAGVRGWMEHRSIPDKLKVSEIISMTKGAFGAQSFADFFKNK